MFIPPPHKRRRLLIALPAGQRSLTLSADIRMALVSNAPYPPGISHEHSHPHLTAREAEVIERLLSVCTHYQHIGEHHISDLVDRIGMKLMQAFMARNNPEAGDI